MFFDEILGSHVDREEVYTELNLLVGGKLRQSDGLLLLALCLSKAFRRIEELEKKVQILGKGLGNEKDDENCAELPVRVDDRF